MFEGIHWAQKTCFDICPCTLSVPSKLSSPSAALLENCLLLGTDKYPSMFLCHMEATVYLYIVRTKDIVHVRLQIELSNDVLYTQQRKKLKQAASFKQRDSTCFNSLTMATSCKGLMYWDNSSSSFSSRNSKKALTLVQSCRGQKSFSRYWYRSCSCGIICCWTFIFSYKQERTASKILIQFSPSCHLMRETPVNIQVHLYIVITYSMLRL